MNLPNLISLGRLFLVPFFFTELVSYRPGAEHHRWAALIIFAFAVLTDALDGYLARVLSQHTALGRFLDPLADKLLLLSGYLGLLLVSGLDYTPPLWVTVTIVFRDVVVVAGLILIFVFSGSAQVQPNFLGKLTTASQMLTLISILLQWKYSFLLWNFTAILTVASCFVYMKRDFHKLSVT